MSRLRLLVVAPTCDGDDVGEAWVGYQWVSRLARRHDVTLLTYNKRGAPRASEQFPQARVIEWEEPPGLGRAERLNSLMKPAYLPFFVRARRWLRRELADGGRFDVGHQVVPVAMRYPTPLLGSGIPYLMGPVGGSLLSPPGFVAEEGTTPWFQKLRALDPIRLHHDPLLRGSYEQAAIVLGIAPYVAELLAGLKLRRFEVLGETGLTGMPPAGRAARTGPVRLVYVGRLVRTKGARDAIRAMSLLGDISVELDIVGDGPDRAECEDLVAEFRLGSRVRFHGRRPRAEVDQFYRDADVFVFPSYREPGGNVQFEAMSHGLPLVVGNRGGTAAAVDESCGFAVDPISPEQYATDIAAAIRTLVGDPALRTRMGAAARERALRIGLWDAKIEAVESFYNEVRSTPEP